MIDDAGITNMATIIEALQNNDQEAILAAGLQGLISTNMAIAEAIDRLTKAVDELVTETCRTGPNHYDS